MHRTPTILLRATLAATLSLATAAQAPSAAQSDPTAAAAAAARALRPVRLNGLGQTVLSPKVRDITKIATLMPVKLTGIGLVTGLAGTGSNDRATRLALLNAMRGSNELNLDISDLSSKNCALVALTCELPPFATEGARVDVKCAAIGDATSLRSGVLLEARLYGPDRTDYVAASGTVIAPGFVAEGNNAQVSQNPGVVGDLLDGGLVIDDVPTSMLTESGHLELRLRNPSAYNASSVASGVQTALEGMNVQVQAVSPAIVRIVMPEAMRNDTAAMQLVKLAGEIRVPVENPCKVTIDQVSGTVLAGEGVLISPCLVTVEDLTIAIVEEDFVSQPNPFSDGTSERVGRTRVEVQQNASELRSLGGGGATVADLLQNLKALGLKPHQLVNVFTNLKKHGFLQADLEVR